MQKGSLIMLALPPTQMDFEMSQTLSIPLAEMGTIYTISEGPFLAYCHRCCKSVLAIRIEELGEGWYNSTLFVEVQSPMTIDLDKILSAKNNNP